MVAKGYNQKEGIDYSETFAPVAKMVTVRTLLGVASHHNWYLHQLDINNAFLHGDLNENVYMSIPQGYYSSTILPGQVYTLNKSLYGLKQANRQWFAKLTDFLLTQGFTQSYADTSLFTKHQDSDFLALLIDVDDILLTGSNLDMIKAIKLELHQAFSIKDLGNLHYCLGLEITKTKEGITDSKKICYVTP